MGDGDLDGDQYFNPSLIPECSAPPPAASTIGSRSTAWKKDMRADAIDTFISMRCNFLLGTISNECMSLVGTAPTLANSIVCLKLVPMIEAALDVVKSGGSIAILKSDFNKMRVFGELSSQGTSGWHPLEFLPGLVPRPLERNRMQFTSAPRPSTPPRVQRARLPPTPVSRPPASSDSVHTDAPGYTNPQAWFRFPRLRRSAYATAVEELETCCYARLITARDCARFASVLRKTTGFWHISS
ncbi:hypothetical protein B0H14DRAFT_3436895 [Mycena olivaceomarginata]|nr:hypothetical protein B0H14DRAFT_3436895 [Mycena olivaceomarginata]